MTLCLPSLNKRTCLRLTPVSFSGQCVCSETITTVKVFVPQGGKAVINWIKPSLKCSSGGKATIESEDVQPPGVSSPSEFGIGRHTVTYTYGYLIGCRVVKVQCSIEINIRGM
jgi:hypothetical protein